MCGGAAGLLTRGSPLRRLPGLRPVALRRRSISPHSGGTVPDSHRVPLPLPFAGDPIMAPCRSRGRFALAARRRLGGRHLRVLVHPEPHDRARDLGPDPAQGRAHDRVRDARLAAPAGDRRELPALALGSPTRSTDELHQHFVRGRHASPIDVAIDTVGLASASSSSGVCSGHVRRLAPDRSDEAGRDRPRRARRHAAALERLARRRGAALSLDRAARPRRAARGPRRGRGGARRVGGARGRRLAGRPRSASPRTALPSTCGPTRRSAPRCASSRRAAIGSASSPTRPSRWPESRSPSSAPTAGSRRSRPAPARSSGCSNGSARTRSSSGTARPRPLESGREGAANSPTASSTPCSSASTG